jgi:hypothetical protein
MKKVYTSPQLLIYGKVSELTQATLENSQADSILGSTTLGTSTQPGPGGSNDACYTYVPPHPQAGECLP